MAKHKASYAVVPVVPLLCLCALLASCQPVVFLPGGPIAPAGGRINPDGLTDPISVEPLRVSVALPYGWQPIALERKGRYVHQQWWSQTRNTSMGVTYIRMPLRLSTRKLIWFAMHEASKQAPDGKLLRQWSDSLGREWFEAERNSLRMTGYVMTRGLDGWINYWSHTTAAQAEEQTLATRALDKVQPMDDAAEAPKTADAPVQTAAAGDGE